MREMNLPQTILLVLGLMMLIKSVWGIAHPSSMKRLGNWWSRAAFQVNTLCGIACMVIAAGMLIAVLLDQPLTNWLLVAFAALFGWAGNVYLKPQELEKLIRTVVVNRTTLAIRIISVVSAIVALLLIRVAYIGL